MVKNTLSSGIGIGNKFQVNISHKEDKSQAYFEDYAQLCLQTIEHIKTLKIHQTNENLLEFQLMVLKDEVLKNNILKYQETLSLEKAIHKGFDAYITLLNQSEDTYLKQRVSDIEDVENRLIQGLHAKRNGKPNEAIILCCEKLFPSYFFEFAPFIKGVLTLKAEPLSHAVLLAKERNIPVLVVDQYDTLEGKLLVDGFKGEIIPNPSLQMINSLSNDSNGLTISHKPCKLFINYSGKEPISKDIKDAVDGIGLYRSEFLYYEKNAFPSLEEQVSIYEQLLDHLDGKPVVIRTYDFGDDKNPLGLENGQRGVSDYILHYEKAFLTQITALLAVNEIKDNLSVLIPMVKSYHDIQLIQNICQGLKDKIGFKKKLPPIGAMIETKEAYQNLDSFKKVAFISIGTNDLGKNLFNIERHDNINIEEVLAVMKEPIHRITDFANTHHIPCTICGDIASSPTALQSLLTQGEKSFSVPIPFLIPAKKIILNHFK